MVPYKIQGGPVGSVLSDDLQVAKLHVEAITVVQGDRITQVNAEGVEEALGPAGKKLSGRGSAICLTLWSECGKRLFLEFQFHKGEVYSHVEESKIDPSEQDSLTELWRD